MADKNTTVPEEFLTIPQVVSRLSNQAHVGNSNGDDFGKRQFFDLAAQQLLQGGFKDKTNPVIRPEWIIPILWYSTHQAAFAADLNRHVIDMRAGLHSQEKSNIAGVWDLLTTRENYEFFITTFFAVMGAAQDLTQRGPESTTNGHNTSASAMPIHLVEDDDANTNTCKNHKSKKK